MKNIKTIRLDSGHILFCDSTNLSHSLSEIKHIDELLEEKYITEKLHTSLRRQKRSNVLHIKEVFSYVEYEKLPYYELCEEESLGVIVKCEEQDIQILQDDREEHDRYIIPLGESEEYDEVKKLGFFSVDGSHFVVTDLSYVERSLFDHTMKEDFDVYQDDLDAFFRTSKGCFRWSDDGLYRVDGYFSEGKIVKIVLQLLPTEDDGYHDEEYLFEG